MTSVSRSPESGEFRGIADTAPVLIWSTDADGRCNWFNQRWLDFTGNTMESALDSGRYSKVHADDREPALETFQAAFGLRDPIELEYQLMNRQGEYRWILERSSPRYEPDAEFAGYVGVCVDITYQHEFRHRLTERAQVMSQLHAISERERSFLARGIHDGLLQDIVGAEMLLGACESLEPNELKSRLERARATIRSAIGHGRKLIGELRPVILDEHGLVSAIEFYAAELESRSGLATRVVNHLDQEISSAVWCGNVFQIVQEALNNVEAHSRAKSATVEVSRTGHRLDIVVTDQGIGFDIEAISDSFGLRCMRERAATYQGTALVQSAPGQGTTVTIQVPLPSVIA